MRTQFVEHFELYGEFVTSIWLRTDTGNYTSVVSDPFEPDGLESLELIRELLTDISFGNVKERKAHVKTN